MGLPYFPQVSFAASACGAHGAIGEAKSPKRELPRREVPLPGSCARQREPSPLVLHTASPSHTPLSLGDCVVTHFTTARTVRSTHDGREEGDVHILLIEDHPGAVCLLRHALSERKARCLFN